MGRLHLCMMLFSSKQICVLFHVGYTMAWLGFRQFSSDATPTGKDFSTHVMWVAGRQTTVKVINSQVFDIKAYLWNRANMIISRENSAVSNSGDLTWHIGAICNEGLPVVRHEKKDLPLFMTIDGVERPHFMLFESWMSENRGSMILSATARRSGPENL